MTAAPARTPFPALVLRRRSPYCGERISCLGKSPAFGASRLSAPPNIWIRYGNRFGQGRQDEQARARHGRLLSSYLVNLHRGEAPVRELMLADIERFESLGAIAYADDLRIALKRFTSEFIDGKDRR